MKRFVILAAFALAFVLVLIVAVRGRSCGGGMCRHELRESMHSREHLLRKAAAPVLTWRRHQS